MKQYDLILLDADDTLFDYKTAEKYALENSAAAFGLNLTKEMGFSYAEINRKLWLEYEQGKVTQDFLRTERFTLLFKKHCMDLDGTQFSAEYLKWLSSGSFLLDGAESVCRYLSEKYTLAIITNGISAVQRSRLQHSAIQHYITHLIISEEARSSKPDPRIFEYAEKITGCTDRAVILIVGDSLSSDIQGGINYGIDTCWFNPNGAENTTAVKPKFEIHTLSTLRDIL